MSAPGRAEEDRPCAIGPAAVTHGADIGPAPRRVGAGDAATTKGGHALHRIQPPTLGREPAPRSRALETRLADRGVRGIGRRDGQRKNEDGLYHEIPHTPRVAYRLDETPKARDQAKDIGLYGLGRMGGNMVTRLARGGQRVLAGNRSREPVQEASKHGAVAASSIEDMAKKLKPPRVLWAMVPAGDVTDHTLDEFARYASPGDVLVDGGNSYFRDSMRRAGKYAGMGFCFLDVGVSGGIWGLENGYCMMVGGPADGVAIAKPALDTLAPPNGWSHFGKNGAGHFVKMVHNGIEYGMMQAYGEGFELLHASEFELDLRKVSTVWLQGSVVRSWLLALAERAFGPERSERT